MKAFLKDRCVLDNGSRRICLWKTLSKCKAAHVTSSLYCEKGSSTAAFLIFECMQMMDKSLKVFTLFMHSSPPLFLAHLGTVPLMSLLSVSLTADLFFNTRSCAPRLKSSFLQVAPLVSLSLPNHILESIIQSKAIEAS